MVCAMRWTRVCGGVSEVLMLSRRVWIVVILLGLASLACYSDSPLWPYDLTPAPPTNTPLPFPDEANLSLTVGDMAYTPTTLRMTTHPEPLRPDLSNKSAQSCSQDSLVEVLYSGITPTNQVYHLVDCSGVVGWTPQENLLGPITIEAGQRALTTQAGADESGAFKIEGNEPPYREDDPFRQHFDCRVGDTVEVLNITGLETGELFYRIECPNPFNPVQPNLGWTPADTLFGPVRFQNGERGLAAQDIGLTAVPDTGETVAVCPGDEVVQITDTSTVRIGDTLYYEVTCEAGTGWTSQDVLLGPLPYEVGQQVLVTAPGVRNSGDPVAPVEVPADATADPVTVATPPPLEEPPRVFLAASPGPVLPDDAVGVCEDANITPIEGFAGADDELYAQVTCDETAGWLAVETLFGPVEYTLGETVELGQTAVIGFSQRGIYLSREIFDIEGPSGGSSVIAGACAYDFSTPGADPAQAVLTDVGYYRSATGTVVGVFFQARCTNDDGETIEGWINQDRIGVN